MKLRYNKVFGNSGAFKGWKCSCINSNGYEIYYTGASRKAARNGLIKNVASEIKSRQDKHIEDMNLLNNLFKRLEKTKES